MSKKEQSIIAVSVVIIAMLMIVLFMQMSVINECWGLHDDQQEVIDKQHVFIDSLMKRNEVLWDKLIEVKYKNR